MDKTERLLRRVCRYRDPGRSTEWLNKSLAVRIRRYDSVLATRDDDVAWHDLQGEEIVYRTDPWIIYEPELPAPRGKE